MEKNVEKVFVFEMGGIPKVMFDFKEDTLVIDEILLSGFLTAIQGFSSSYLENASSHFVINTGENKITLFKNAQITIAILSKEELVYLQKDFDILIDFFIKKYPVGTGQVLDADAYIDFKIKLIRTLFYLPIAEDWIPIANDKCTQEEYNALFKEFPITERSSKPVEIQKLKGFDRNKKEEIYELLNYAWYEECIHFKNQIEPRDYIQPTARLLSTIHGDDETYQQLKAEFKNFKILKFVDEVQKLKRIFELENILGINREVLLKDLILLYNKGYIELINEEQHQLLITIDIMNDFFEILECVDKKQKYKKDVINIIDQMDTPEITTRIDLNVTPFYINKQNILPRSHESSSIEQKIKVWGQFGMSLMEGLYGNYKKKFNQQFFNRITEHYLEYLHRYDATILDQFLITIERY